MERYSPATRVTFVSHAATAAQRNAAFPVDEALEETALVALGELKWTAPRAQQILCGPERRTQQTAAELGLDAAVETELRDCDYGRWSGLSLDEAQESDAEGVAAWLTDPGAAVHGGESVAALVGRVGRWLEGTRDAGHVVAVTHPAVIRAALVWAVDAPVGSFWRVEIAPLTVTDMRFNGRVWVVRSLGCGMGGEL